MIIVILVIIWIISFIITAARFSENEIPFNLGNFILSVTPIINTIIAIKLSIKVWKGVNIFKDMKDTINIVFRK